MLQKNFLSGEDSAGTKKKKSARKNGKFPHASHLLIASRQLAYRRASSHAAIIFYLFFIRYSIFIRLEKLLFLFFLTPLGLYNCQLDFYNLTFTQTNVSPSPRICLYPPNQTSLNGCDAAGYARQLAIDAIAPIVVTGVSAIILFIFLLASFCTPLYASSHSERNEILFFCFG